MKNKKNTTKSKERYFLSLKNKKTGEYEDNFMFNTRTYPSKESLLNFLEEYCDESKFPNHDFKDRKVFKKVETKSIEWLEV
mgnify:CR=1 FL=1